jgi:hypothetical protein
MLSGQVLYHLRHVLGLFLLRVHFPFMRLYSHSLIPLQRSHLQKQSPWEEDFNIGILERTQTVRPLHCAPNVFHFLTPASLPLLSHFLYLEHLFPAWINSVHPLNSIQLNSTQAKLHTVFSTLYTPTPG